MKKQILWSSLLLSLFSITGCVATIRTRPLVTAEVIVDEPPPPPRVVVRTRPPMPQANAVWVEGNWRWSGSQYVWVKGHWIAPRSGYVYVQPRWERRGRGWVRVGGTWRARGEVRVNSRRSQPKTRSRTEVRQSQQRIQRAEPQSSSPSGRQPKSGVRVK